MSRFEPVMHEKPIIPARVEATMRFRIGDIVFFMLQDAVYRGEVTRLIIMRDNMRYHVSTKHLEKELADSDLYLNPEDVFNSDPIN